MTYPSAEWINEHRVFPRIFVLSFLCFYCFIVVKVFNWFIAFDWNTLPTDQIVGTAGVAAVAGFPTLILTAMGKTLKELIESYWNGSSTKTPGV